MKSVRGTSPLTTQQPTVWQGANAWIDGAIRIKVHLFDGLSFDLFVE